MVSPRLRRRHRVPRGCKTYADGLYRLTPSLLANKFLIRDHMQSNLLFLDDLSSMDVPHPKLKRSSGHVVHGKDKHGSRSGIKLPSGRLSENKGQLAT